MPKPRKVRLARARSGVSGKRQDVAVSPRSLPPWRRWAWRVGLAFGVPAAVLLLAELVLRIVGSGYSTAYFIPSSEPGHSIPNEHFARQFFAKQSVSRPFLEKIATPKPAGEVRVFLLGESAAMGTPDPAFGPARILELMFRRQYPQKNVEVINVAMRGIDSHVLRRIALDCARQQPDLFIVYTGNNEGVGLHAPTPGTPRFAMNLSLIRFSHFCKRTRLGQWVCDFLADRRKPEPQDMEFFRKMRNHADDPRLEQLRRNFRANLVDICRAGGEGLSKILATVAVNLKDCPPLGSLHRRDLSATDLAKWNAAWNSALAAETAGRWLEAIDHFQAAARLDDHYAELHYRLARCLLLADRVEEAKRHFVLARDWDTLPFRADTRLNAIVRAIASENPAQNVRLAEVERDFAGSESSPHGIPGHPLFYEHVHPSFDGAYLLAKSLYPVARQSLETLLGQPATDDLPSRDECARALAYTPLDEFNVVSAFVRLTGSPPFLDQVDHAARQGAFEQELQQLKAALTEEAARKCLALHAERVVEHPQDWCLRFNLANLYLQLRRPQDAAAQFQELVKQYPEVAPFRMALEQVSARAGPPDTGSRPPQDAKNRRPHETRATNALFTRR